MAREWVVTFAELYRVSLKERGPRFVDLWAMALADLEASVLDAACKRAMQTCKFFPMPADIREHVDRTKENAVVQAAEIEWQRVLDLRRRYFNPDMAGGFSRGMPKLSECVDRAARASGIFRLQDCDPDAIHVWTKKRFVESYIAWSELEQDQFLLPEGEIKNLLAGAAAAKQLPRGSVDEYQAARAAGEKHRQRLGEYSTAIRELQHDARRPTRLWDSDEERKAAFAALERKERETNPRLIDKIHSQRAALEAKGFRLHSPTQQERANAIEVETA